jgi:hypothetical protein
MSRRRCTSKRYKVGRRHGLYDLPFAEGFCRVVYNQGMGVYFPARSWRRVKSIEVLTTIPHRYIVANILYQQKRPCSDILLVNLEDPRIVWNS